MSGLMEAYRVQQHEFTDQNMNIEGKKRYCNDHNRVCDSCGPESDHCPANKGHKEYLERIKQGVF